MQDAFTLPVVSEADASVVLSDPSAHTADEVVAAFAAATPEQIEEAKRVESESSRPRKTVLDWRSPDEPPDDGQERYGADGWKERARGHLGVSPHAVVGALYGSDPGQVFTKAQVQDRLEKWLNPKGAE